MFGHVGSAVRFGTNLLRDDRPVWEPVDPPGAVVEGEPGAWWETLAGPAREAVSGVELSRVVESPMGRRSIGEGLSFPALDLFVHAWDLGRVVGADVDIWFRCVSFSRAESARVTKYHPWARGSASLRWRARSFPTPAASLVEPQPVISASAGRAGSWTRVCCSDQFVMLSWFSPV